jgi:outer membrane autotransporter protein
VARLLHPAPDGQRLCPSTKIFEWAHQYNSANAAVPVPVAYSNDPQHLSLFIGAADPVSRNYVDLGVGLALQMSAGQSAFISYDGIVGLNHTTYNNFVAGVRFTF